MTGNVVGPITTGTRGRPFAATLLDIGSYGYVEEEYFLEGAATRYRDVGDSLSRTDGHWHAEPVDQAPYRTRILIYRPVDRDAFNGTVVLTWNNVTAGHDLFNADSLELFEGGFGLAFLTTQTVGVDGLPPARQGLVAWDPERYGSLSIPSDDYSYDIFTQAVGVIRSSGATGPRVMGDLPVKHVVAQGASQSAIRLATYINAIQPLTNALDGFILSIYFARRTALEVGETVVNINAVSDESPRERLMGQVRLRDDLGVPIFVVNSEMEAISCFGVRQNDSDTFRYWEAAGTCHVSQQNQAARAKLMARDGIVGRPQREGINAIPMNPLYDAAYHHMHRWLEEGRPPPVQPRIEFAGEPPEIVRDQNGIARGGIRLPQVEVPVACNSAIPRSADIFAVLDGSCEPFSLDRVRQLYSNKATYLARFEAAAERAVTAGVLMRRDVAPLLDEAGNNWPAD